jgi:DNA-binding XRE family transcriptional regulator
MLSASERPHTAAACRHRWKIAPPAGRVSEGVCAYCGARRDFPNSFFPEEKGGRPPFGLPASAGRRDRRPSSRRGKPAASRVPRALAGANAPQSPLHAEFGAHLRTLRERRGLTQGDIAIAAGKSRTAVTLWESGASTPQYPSLRAYADAVGVSYRVLVPARFAAIFRDRGRHTSGRRREVPA